MKLIVVFSLVSYMLTGVGLANGYNDSEWKEYVKGEIAHKRKMKELQAIHQIYADQILLGKSSHVINNSLNNGSSSISESQSTSTSSVTSGISQRSRM